MNQSDLRFLPRQDRKAISAISEMLNQKAFQKAEAAALALLRSTSAAGSRRDKFVRLEAAGLLIDIGAEAKAGAVVRQGLDVLESDRDALGPLVTAYSYEYCLGNAQMALYEIEHGDDTEVPTLDETKALLKAKNHFWRSVKAMATQNSPVRDQVLTNLASALFLSGRMVEALDYLDEVLLVSPHFPYARHHRGKTLLGLARLTGGPTPRLVDLAMKDFAAAAQSADFPCGARALSGRYAEKCKAWLDQHARKAPDSDHNSQKLAEEEKKHSVFRKWCLNERLALSEHALYCWCAGARRDDLMVATRSAKVSGEIGLRRDGSTIGTLPQPAKIGIRTCAVALVRLHRR